MYDLNEFAQRLKFFRKKKGWTQPQLAEKTGVAESTIYFYEVGRNYPNIILLKYLCEALEVSSNNLIGLGETTIEVDLPADFSQRLKYFRKLKGIGQKRLVRLSNVSLSQIQNYEHYRSSPNVLILKKLSDALNVSGGDLLGF